MAFNKFCAVLKDNCGTLKITDNTGVYHETTNPLGWNSPDTISAADLDAATITYVMGDGDIADGTTIDVLANIPDPIVGSFILAEIELDSYADGFIKIQYQLTAGDETYTTTYKIFFTCESRCCIEKMWAKVAENCDCNCESNDLIQDALMAEGLLRAVNSAAACVTSEGRAEILAKIKRLCDFNDCGCGC